MSEFKCSVCNYTSSLKSHVIRHMNKKVSCGQGIKEVIEIPVEITCEFCNKKFMSKHNLKIHTKNSCKQKDLIKDEEIRKLKEELNEANNLLKSRIINKTSIRAEARKIYKNYSPNLECVHCKNKNEKNIQICHIKPVKNFITTEGMNDLSNLISLCANCHLDLDKLEKFEVIRTSKLHSFMIKHIEKLNPFMSI